MRQALKTPLIVSLLALAACSAPAAPSNDSAAAPAVSDPAPTTQAALLTPIAEDLDVPWDMAVLPDGDLLITERHGGLRLVSDGVLQDAPIAGLPEMFQKRQGGLFDIALDKDFADNRTVYVSYAKGRLQANGTALLRATLSEDKTRLNDVEMIFEMSPQKPKAYHFGGRIGQLDDGSLILTLGDGFDQMDKAQTLDNHFGKIVRINPDGSVPSDNPFVGQDGAKPEIWSYGHRNVQGLAIDHANGVVYANEHGPRGGDEVNIIEPGKNYGWPVISYGINYDGTIITDKTEAEGMEQPIVKWVPSIAPAGMIQVKSDKHSDWSGDLLVSALAGSKIQRIDLEDGKVVAEETVLEGEYRWRFIHEGPDGTFYLGEDSFGGSVFIWNPDAS